MARPQRNIFNFEQRSGIRGAGASALATAPEERHAQIMAALADLRKMGVSAGSAEPHDENAPMSQVSEKFMEDYKIGMDKVAALKSDMAEIQQAINNTKKEIVSLHHTGFSQERMSLVNDELGEVVDGTEKATETILGAAEEIDNNASDLCAKLEGDTDQNMAAEIQENVIKIFEACNFQDVTGQRINKVVNTLRFVDERVSRMMEIWGGIDSFENITPEVPPNPSGDDELLHGPGNIDEDPTRASQNDIDALFD